MVEAPFFGKRVKWCSVPLSETIERGKRLEAAVFDLDLKDAKRVLDQSGLPMSPLCGENGLASSYRPGICKRIFVEYSPTAIPMFTPSQIVDLLPKPEKYLSRQMEESIGNWFVREGELLLTCSGTVGKCTLVTKTLKGKCVSQNLIRIVPRRPEQLGYLYTYLRTKIGQLMLTRNNYGAVIQHIDPEHLSGVPVPDAPEETVQEIHRLVMESFALRDSSNDLLEAANNLLFQELELPPFQEFKAEPRAFSVPISRLEGRADASFHIPLADKILSHLQAHAAEIVPAGNPRVSQGIILPGRFKRVYVEEGMGRVFFGGKQLGELDPSNKKYLSLSQHAARIKRQLELKQNMVLVTCSGTIGKVALVPKHWENWTANQHIIRIVPADSGIAGYLSVFLSTDYARTLICRFTYGSVVDEIDAAHAARIPIPFLKNGEAQKEINALALEANEKRYKAYLLEKEASAVMERDVFHLGGQPLP